VPTITCPQCQQPYDDAELFCPHCGAAQIPQAGKDDLRRQQAEYRRRPREALLGMLIGLGVGVVLLVTVGPLLPPGEGAEKVALLVMPVVIGLVGGLVVRRVLRSRGSVSRRWKNARRKHL
jgi:hypothetical protein